MLIVIQGSLLNLNQYINLCRENKYKAAKAKEEIEKIIILKIKRQVVGKEIVNPSIFNFKWYEKDKRRDPDNICFAKKFILDFFVKAGLMKNDGWNEVKGFTDDFYVDKKNQRIEVEIMEE